MKVVISLTSIPSRFDKLGPILQNLALQTCHEVWLNIPHRYNRFPEWDGAIPEDLYDIDPKVVINRDCEDFGPGTKFIAPAIKLLPDDLIIYVDDDTAYDARVATNLLKWHQTDTKSAWGLSGFTFENYFKNSFPRQHGVPLDVLEGYGAVIVKAKWVQDALPEFKELLVEARAADDVIISNLLEKAGIKRKTVYTPDCHLGHVQQYQYGFDQDALHHQFTGGHHVNYKNVLRALEDKAKSYFMYKTC